MMQPLDEALTMLADRGENLPADIMITRVEAALGAPIVASEVRSGVADTTAGSVESALPGSLRRRVARPSFAFAVAAVVVFTVVAGVTWLLAAGGGEPADVPPVNTTIVDQGLDAMLSVTFDGNHCTIQGPSAIAAAAVVPVVFTNTSGTPADFHVARLGPNLAREERTFEDFVELQRASGGALRDDPTNLGDSPINWLRTEPFSFDHNAYRLAPTLTDNQTLKVYQLRPEAGTSVVYVTRMGPFDPDYRVNPETYWFCAPLEVTSIDF